MGVSQGALCVAEGAYAVVGGRLSLRIARVMDAVISCRDRNLQLNVKDYARSISQKTQR